MNTNWILTLSLAILLPVQAEVSGDWRIWVHEDIRGEPALRAAIEDLIRTARGLGISSLETDSLDNLGSGPALFVGGAPSGVSWHELEPPPNTEGFALRTFREDNSVALQLSGGSVLGNVYGLYWLRDRLRVHRKIPELDVVRAPAFPIRHVGAEGEEDIQLALCYSANWVSGGNNLDYFPWDVEPEATANRRNRERLKKLIETAHEHHLKYLLGGDEFSYHPSFLKEVGATANPCDPKFWDAVQEKFRRLLRALPELDGVRVRTGEHTRVGGNYLPFDVMHEGEDCDWSLEKRYRTFVRKMHEVVVGEFEKIYFHRTWVTNATEQHSDPEVYKRIFTEEVPTENLYLSPYLSLADRWYYQPFNPTFNQTPHAMVVLLAPLDYHAHSGVPVLPSFPGQYFQEGIESILAVSNSNLRGVQFAAPQDDLWGTGSLTGYTAFRLAWDPHEDLRQIAEDYAALHLGPEAAPKMAEILLLTRTAYEDGIYIKPVAESIRGNTLPHLRLTTFQRRGIPEIDRGREHAEWLQHTMYGPSIGKTREAIEHLDRGLVATLQMKELFEEAGPSIEDAGMRTKIAEEVDLTHALVATNNLYVKTCYAYFEYREKRDEESRKHLEETLSSLDESVEDFRETPGFCYRLDGIETLIDLAQAAAQDLEAAEASLAGAPARPETLARIAKQQSRMKGIVEEREKDLKKILHWRGKVDGTDVLSIRGDEVGVEHLQGDDPAEMQEEFSNPLPQTTGVAVLKDLGSPDYHPFILEQPGPGNDSTLKIYLLDRPPGYSWWEFEVYWMEDGGQSDFDFARRGVETPR